MRIRIEVLVVERYPLASNWSIGSAFVRIGVWPGAQCIDHWWYIYSIIGRYFVLDSLRPSSRIELSMGLTIEVALVFNIFITLWFACLHCPHAGGTIAKGAQWLVGLHHLVPSVLVNLIGSSAVNLDAVLR